MIERVADLIVSDTIGAMPSWNHPRTAVGVRLFVDVGEENDVPADRCLAGTGLSSADLADADRLIEASQEVHVARNVARALGDRPGLGVDAGRRITTGRLGIWAFAALTSATWGDALALLLRYHRLSPAFLAADLHVGTHEFRLVLGDDELPPDVRGILAERDLTAAATFLAAVVGTMPALRLETRLGADRAGCLARAVAPSVRVVPGRARHTLAGDRALLSLPLPQGDEHTRRACERECALLLERHRSRAGTASRVRGRLLEHPAAMPSMAEVAAELHVDVRTLRRQLSEEGTSFRALRDETLGALAVELLATAGLTVDDVAGRLGYADATSFAHAFRRWKGAPPSAYRQRRPEA